MLNFKSNHDQILCIQIRSSDRQIKITDFGSKSNCNLNLPITDNSALDSRVYKEKELCDGDMQHDAGKFTRSFSGVVGKGVTVCFLLK